MRIAVLKRFAVLHDQQPPTGSQSCPLRKLEWLGGSVRQPDARQVEINGGVAGADIRELQELRVIAALRVVMQLTYAEELLQRPVADGALDLNRLGIDQIAAKVIRFESDRLRTEADRNARLPRIGDAPAAARQLTGRSWSLPASRMSRTLTQPVPSTVATVLSTMSGAGVVTANSTGGASRVVIRSATYSAHWPKNDKRLAKF